MHNALIPPMGAIHIPAVPCIVKKTRKTNSVYKQSNELGQDGKVSESIREPEFHCYVYFPSLTPQIA